jgi:hypothetical protein
MLSIMTVESLIMNNFEVMSNRFIIDTICFEVRSFIIITRLEVYKIGIML